MHSNPCLYILKGEVEGSAARVLPPPFVLVQDFLSLCSCPPNLRDPFLCLMCALSLQMWGHMMISAGDLFWGLVAR